MPPTLQLGFFSPLAKTRRRLPRVQLVGCVLVATWLFACGSESKESALGPTSGGSSGQAGTGATGGTAAQGGVGGSAAGAAGTGGEGGGVRPTDMLLVQERFNGTTPSDLASRLFWGEDSTALYDDGECWAAAGSRSQDPPAITLIGGTVQATASLVFEGASDELALGDVFQPGDNLSLDLAPGFGPLTVPQPFTFVSSEAITSLHRTGELPITYSGSDASHLLVLIQIDEGEQRYRAVCVSPLTGSFSAPSAWLASLPAMASTAELIVAPVTHQLAEGRVFLVGGEGTRGEVEINE